MVSVAQWQSTGLWLQGLRVRVPPFTPDAPIAQPDRAPDFESVGREFESPWARHMKISGSRVEGWEARVLSSDVKLRRFPYFYTLYPNPYTLLQCAHSSAWIERLPSKQ